MKPNGTTQPAPGEKPDSLEELLALIPRAIPLKAGHPEEIEVSEETREDSVTDEGQDLLDALRDVVPEVFDALARVPSALEFLRRVRDKPVPVWDPCSEVDLTTKIYCAGIQLELEVLKARLDEIETKYEVARAAERNWRQMLQERTRIVFRSDAGDVAKLPVDLVRVIAAKGTFDGEVVAKAKTVVFVSGGKTLAEIPKSLFVCLGRILETYDAATARGSKSQSRDSHERAPSLPSEMAAPRKSREKRDEAGRGRA